MPLTSAKSKTLAVSTRTAPKRTATRRKATPVTEEVTMGLSSLSEAVSIAAVSASAVSVSMDTPTREIGWQDIADRAYCLWMERGCPAGSSDEDWFRAEVELGVRA